MDILRIRTQRGLELKGAIFDGGSRENVLIMLSGICSNVFQNDLLSATGELLSKNGITCIIAHAMDSFSCLAYSDFSTGKQKNTGVVFDDFSVVYEDVESYVKYAKKEGYKNIILAGHSLGSNKVIHYLGNTSDDFVDYFIVSSPIDIMHWWKIMPDIDRCFYFIVSSPIDIMHWWKIMPDIDRCFNLAKQFVDKNRGNDILPYMFGGFSPMSANAVLGFYHADNLKNCPVISGIGETNSLYSIKPNGSFIIGSKDSVVGGDAEGFMNKLNALTKHPYDNQVIVVPDASHIFYNKHNEYASTILDCIQKHFAFIAV